MNKYMGSCLCGKVTFQIKGDFEQFYLCHCEHCRKDTGSAHAANLFSSTAQLEWLSGSEYIRRFDYQSSGHIKSFCTNCGSALPNMQMNDSLLVVPAGSLDTDAEIIPKAHIFYSHRATWDKDLHTLKKFDELPK